MTKMSLANIKHAHTHILLVGGRSVEFFTTLVSPWGLPHDILAAFPEKDRADGVFTGTRWKLQWFLNLRGVILLPCSVHQSRTESSPH